MLHHQGAAFQPTQAASSFCKSSMVAILILVVVQQTVFFAVLFLGFSLYMFVQVETQIVSLMLSENEQELHVI